MNKTKRGLELAAAIMSIVFGGILLIGAIALIQAANVAMKDPSITSEAMMALEITKTSLYLIIAFSIALIVIASLLCPSPKEDSKTGNIKDRKGLGITLAVMTGLIALTEISGGQIVYGILIAIPCVFIIVSLCMKHEACNNCVMYTNQQTSNNYAPTNMFTPRVEEPQQEEKDTSNNVDKNQ